MAVREQKLNTKAPGITVDLSFISKSKVKSVLVKLGNLLTLGLLRGVDDYDPIKFDLKKAKELQMVNYNNVANIAHFYNRRF